MARRRKEAEQVTLNPGKVHFYQNEKDSTAVYLSGSLDTYGSRSTTIELRQKIGDFTEYHKITIDCFGKPINPSSYKVESGRGRVPLVAPNYKKTLKLALRAIPRIK